MNLLNDYASYQKQSILDRYPHAFDVELKHDRFKEGLRIRESNCMGYTELTWGKLPSGRYVFLSRWQGFSLRQLI
jgi:hypothetical protein